MDERRYENIVNLRRYRTLRQFRNILIIIALFLFGMLAGIHLKSNLSHAPKTPVWKTFPVSH